MHLSKDSREQISSLKTWTKALNFLLDFVLFFPILHILNLSYLVSLARRKREAFGRMQMSEKSDKKAFLCKLYQSRDNSSQK